MDLVQDLGKISSQSEKDLEDSGKATINHNKEVIEETKEDSGDTTILWENDMWK